MADEWLWNAYELKKFYFYFAYPLPFISYLQNLFTFLYLW